MERLALSPRNAGEIRGAKLQIALRQAQKRVTS